MTQLHPDVLKTLEKILHAAKQHGLFYEFPTEEGSTLLTVWKDAGKKEEIVKLLFKPGESITGHIEDYRIKHRWGIDKTNITGLAVAAIESFATGSTGNDTLFGLARR